MSYNKQSSSTYYQKNKEFIKHKRKLTRLKESPEDRSKRLAFHKEYNSKPENIATRKALQKSDKYKYSYGYKYPAKKRGYIFELTFDEFVGLIHQKCYLCGEIEAGGVDRVDNSIGYILKNSKPCCEMCNKLKWAHSTEDFLNQVSKIHRHTHMV